MTTDDLAERLLADRARGDVSPQWLNGAIQLDDALELQLAILAAERRKGRSVGGWKVGLTSQTVRDRLGVDERPFGVILSDRVFESGCRLNASDISEPSIETEMCFTIGSAITDPTITPDRVLDHVAAVSAGFEINERRPGSARPDFCAMVTDGLTNWGIVAGSALSPPIDAAALSAATITMTRNGEQVFQGVSSDHCDDHAESLCRLVSTMARHGQTLQAGQRVITGAFTRVPVEPGTTFAATYTVDTTGSGTDQRVSTAEVSFR
jgi:2-keto-4-pentenoate hydratase